MIGRAPWLALVILGIVGIGGCHRDYLPSSAGPYLRMRAGEAPIAGITPPPSAWVTGEGLPSPSTACVDEKEALERALSLSSVACSSISLAPVPAIGDGDAPVSDGYAPVDDGGGPVPICYRLGRRLLVVEYASGSGDCAARRIVGMAVFRAHH